MKTVAGMTLGQFERAYRVAVMKYAGPGFTRARAWFRLEMPDSLLHPATILEMMPLRRRGFHTIAGTGKPRLTEAESAQLFRAVLEIHAEFQELEQSGKVA